MDESYEDFLITLVLLDEQSVMRALEYVVSDWTSRCNRSTNLNVEFGDLWNFNDHSNHERWASIAKYSDNQLYLLQTWCMHVNSVGGELMTIPTYYGSKYIGRSSW